MGKSRNILSISGLILGFALLLFATQSALAGEGSIFFVDPDNAIVTFAEPDDLALQGFGLTAKALFTRIDDFTLHVTVTNTSTGVPTGFSNSDQILSTVSWDFGHPGFNGDTQIIGGSVFTGPTSSTVNFDNIPSQLGPNSNVSGEFGFGNMDGTGGLTNFISSNNAQVIPFGGPNLDGPLSIDGPQGGLITDPAIVDLGGLGAISNEYFAIINLDPNAPRMTDLSFLERDSADPFRPLVRAEWGSDSAFSTVVPEPGTLGLVVLGGLGLLGVRRKRRIL